MNKFLGCNCFGKCADWAPLVLRVALGTVFFMHGYQKVFQTGVENVAGFLGSLSIPLPEFMAYILSYGELVGGALLIVGFLTHWAAKFATIVAVVAFFTVHVKNGFFISDGGTEFIILIGAAAVSLMITGAGKYSLDARWHKSS